jgi:hypothetical protein
VVGSGNTPRCHGIKSVGPGKNRAAGGDRGKLMLISYGKLFSQINLSKRILYLNPMIGCQEWWCRSWTVGC